jgi:hypothetical protein
MGNRLDGAVGTGMWMVVFKGRVIFFCQIDSSSSPRPTAQLLGQYPCDRLRGDSPALTNIPRWGQIGQTVSTAAIKSSSA